ncbi:hypothetical protein FRC14_003527 [Serendipita sp. 396]|nr:hypothetical protein FRC14_003527 [Serendipita sp. 396]
MLISLLFRLFSPFLIFGTAVYSLKWPFSSPKRAMMRATPQLEPSDNDISDITLSTQERNAIFRNLDYLDSHRINTDNDCFLDVSKDMDQRCEQMEANQLARVDAAIHLTICELKTAEHVTIPMECTEYTASSRSVRPSGSRACVEALYRSPQFWSSYSGYLRDIPQLCFAYRRWNEIDTAKTVYRNATIEKIAFLKIIQRRQLQLSEQETQLSLRLNDMEVIEDKLKLSVTSLGTRSDVLLSSLQAVIRETDNHLIMLKKQLMQAINEQALTHGEQLSTLVRHAEEEHTNALHTLLQGADHSLGNVHSLIKDLTVEAESISIITANARDEWPKLQTYMESFSTAVSTVNEALDTISHDLNVQSEVFSQMKEEQKEVASSLAQLGTTVSHLANMAQEHAEIINATAIMTRRNFLQVESDHVLSTFVRNILQLMSLLSLFDGLPLRMSSFRLFGLASSVCQVLWCAVSSTMTSFLVREALCL